MPRLNVGVLGRSHDHVWGNLAALAAGHHGRLVAAADPDAGLRDRLRALHGAVATHDTFDAVLERRDLDAVLVFSDNRTSAELGVRALGRRLPVMLEKPMAADLAGARALLAAARTAGVPLMVNWPTAWRPALRHGLALALGGGVGAPVPLSHRRGPGGPRRAGRRDDRLRRARNAARPPAAPDARGRARRGRARAGRLAGGQPLPRSAAARSRRVRRPHAFPRLRERGPRRDRLLRRRRRVRRPGGHRRRAALERDGPAGGAAATAASRVAPGRRR